MTGEREPELRLFVAIELDPEWREALEEAQAAMRAELERHGGPKLRWVRPDGVHLTLKFLGAVPASKLDSVTNALTRATLRAPGFGLSIGHASYFGDRRGPRVVWLGLDGVTPEDRQRLYRLVESIETWLAAAGFPRDRGFTPHLTMARLPETLSREERAIVADVVTKAPPSGAAPMAVRSISLMRSHLGPAGARYERIATFPA